MSLLRVIVQLNFNLRRLMYNLTFAQHCTFITVRVSWNLY
jgi:hypothetical protein